jgi:hypothetical protein
VADPRIVTPQEAQRSFACAPLLPPPGNEVVRDLAHTVATEPDRTRAAVVKALDDLATIGAGANFARIVRARADAFRRGERDL